MKQIVQFQKTLLLLATLLLFGQCKTPYTQSFPQRNFPQQRASPSGVDKSAVKNLYVLKMVECAQEFPFENDSLEVRKFLPEAYCNGNGGPLSQSFYYLFLYLMEDGTAYYGSTIQLTDPVDKLLRRGPFRRQIKVHRDRDRISRRIFFRSTGQRTPRFKNFQKRNDYEDSLLHFYAQQPIVEELYMGSYQADSSGEITLQLFSNKWKIRFKQDAAVPYYKVKVKKKREALHRVDFSFYDVPDFSYRVHFKPRAQLLKLKKIGYLDASLIFTFMRPHTIADTTSRGGLPASVKLCKVVDVAGELTTVKTATDADEFKAEKLVSYELVFQQRDPQDFRPYFLVSSPRSSRVRYDFDWAEFPAIKR
ncbi:MAG: hypothetical protein KDC44_19510 [Phaeodactylibacter sp.]|nr:hypothetical protein [Phaeodactylibacter sp.]